MGAGMKPNGGIDLFDMHTWYMMTIKEEFPFERDWRRASQVSMQAPSRHAQMLGVAP